MCIRARTTKRAVHDAQTALQAGLTSLEITLTTPHACSIIHDLRVCYPFATIGAGTVLTCEDVDLVHGVGAQFIFTPVFDAAVHAAAVKRNMLIVPGAFTPSECFAAHRKGARVVKIFPICSCGYETFVNCIRDIFPNLLLLPAGGVHISHAKKLLACDNVLAVVTSLKQDGTVPTKVNARLLAQCAQQARR